MSALSLPENFATARACIVCSLIKDFEQFEADGCDNCEEFLHMKNNRENISRCTSKNFEGIAAIMEPKDSWVAKWLRISHLARGIYAISVSGSLPPKYVKRMERKGINYRSRNREASRF